MKSTFKFRDLYLFIFCMLATSRAFAAASDILTPFNTELTSMQTPAMSIAGKFIVIATIGALAMWVVGGLRAGWFFKPFAAVLGGMALITWVGTVFI